MPVDPTRKSIALVLTSLILAITLAVTASAGHGNFAQRQVNQAIRAQQRQNNHHNNQQIVFVPVQQQQFRYVPAQNFRQNFSNDCGCQNDGQLQLRQNFGGGCSSLYR